MTHRQVFLNDRPACQIWRRARSFQYDAPEIHHLFDTLWISLQNKVCQTTLNNVNKIIVTDNRLEVADLSE